MGQKDLFTTCQGVYGSGPFAGKPVAHPYKTVLSRLREIGVSVPDRQVDETAHEYIARLDRTYTGLFKDIMGHTPGGRGPGAAAPSPARS